MKYFIGLLVVLNFSLLQAQQTEWSTSIGGSMNDSSQSLVSDVDGNVIVVGSFDMIVDFDPSVNEALFTNTGKTDLYIIKYSSKGDFIWVKTVEDAAGGYNRINCIAIDNKNNLLISGTFRGTVDFDPGSDVFNLYAEFNNKYVLKLDRDGNFIWVKNAIEGEASSEINDLHVRPNSEIIITGDIRGSSLNMIGGYNDGYAYVLKLDKFGNTIWVKVFQGTTEYGYGMKIYTDDSGNVYALGRFQERVDFNPNANTFYLTPEPGQNIYYVKLSAEGDFIWAKSFPLSTIFNQSFYFDKVTNRLLIAGVFYLKLELSTTSGDVAFTSNGVRDICILESTIDGDITAAYQIGGPGRDYATAIIKDRCGNVVLAGSFSDSVDFDPGPNDATFTTSDESKFICKYNNGYEVDWFAPIWMNTYIRRLDTHIDNAVIACGQYDATVNIDSHTDGWVSKFERCALQELHSAVS